MTMYLRYAARSDRGLVRSNNQDSVFAGPRLLAVADGMGGHVGGEIASGIVISAIEYLDEDDSGGDMLEALRGAVDTGTEILRETVAERPELDGMGTTLTAMLFNGRRIGVCHVGDSRAYLFRDNELHQLTHDDTFVQALIDEGRITQEEADVHPQRSVILRALNGMDVDPDLSIREGRAGDRYLLCSDGLSSFVSAERIEKVLRTSEAPGPAADALVDFALRAGGPDNVTVIVADLVDDHESDTVDGVPVVDGAVGGNQSQREDRADSPAARAALIGKRDEPDEQPAEVDDEEPTEKPRRRRRWWILLALFAVLIAAAVTGRAYVASQYFVGADGDKVVIYNGVDAELGPVNLYSVAETTDYKLSDLQQATRGDIEAGVSADSLDDARAIVKRLDQYLLPLCPEDEDDDSATSSGSATSGSSAPQSSANQSSSGSSASSSGDAASSGTNASNTSSSAAASSGSAASTSADANTSADGQNQPTDCRPGA
ncbi:PP2C family protein-serine/threonine phosphatase [Cumulibacter soli]|uniref:PP2C family protein-serine/threonine phosphatase n=1 Tax=Cumulibacter soli TaxID=2546344 RepID=UPI001068844F|nr:PP2C family serine/threonine-protein phosphatase [Cumulibacter soli]